jgi:hypothetical protein
MRRILGVSLAVLALSGCAGLERTRFETAGIVENPTRVRGQDPAAVPDARLPDLPSAVPPETVEPEAAEMSSILRNRVIDSGGEERYDYPDLHIDPRDDYRDRHGVSRPDAERFVIPGLVNLLFEDRWLLADREPRQALENQLRRRLKVNIRDPDPDTANFPNGAYTVPKGRIYIENSPLGLYAISRDGTQPANYQWEYLLRYGLTDNLEFRLFSNGLTYQSALENQASVFGYSPLAFDFKANFWEENTRYFIPAMGMEVYLQTDFGSGAFNGGTQPSINLLFDQSLPFEVGFEYNFGLNGVRNNDDAISYQFSFQWSLQRELFTDFDVFFHGFYNAASLPRLIRYQNPQVDNSIPAMLVLGGGAIWTLNDRVAVFGSFNLGATDAAPRTIALLGFAVAM